ISGRYILEYLSEVLDVPYESLYKIVPDELEVIKRSLIELCDSGCYLVLTTGGTGPAPRDVTPEATLAISDRELPGFGELMRRVSLEQVPTAILSRQTAATRGKSLIVNLPGKPQSIRICLDAVFPAIPYCIELLGGPFIKTKGHIKAFRPA
ncbi:MAG: molybdopterin adenylyltransferase, partial [Aquificaceae bacterium]|nr:molybdopterin adenylyltransferase [Aquificaceae bacterium]